MLNSHKIILFGKTLLSYSDAFTRGNGAIAGGWTGATWTIASNKAVNTPVAGSELLTNGTFAVDANWSKGAGWTIAAGEAIATAVNSTGLSQAGVMSSSGFYPTSYDVTTYVSGGAVLSTSMGITPIISGAGTMASDTPMTATDTDFTLNVAGPGTLHIDNASLKKFTLTDLVCTQNFKRPNGLTQADITVSTNRLAGVTMNVDNPASVQNCVVAVIMPAMSRVYLLKVVSGVLSLVSTTVISYVSGQSLKLTKFGTTYKVYYNGALVKTNTISDTGITHNVYHGLVSMNSANTIDNFVGAYS